MKLFTTPDKLTMLDVLKQVEKLENELLEWEGMGEWPPEQIRDEYHAYNGLLDCMMKYWAESGAFYSEPGIVKGATSVADILGVLMYYKPIIGVNKGRV